MSSTEQSQLGRDAPVNLCGSCAKNAPLQDDNEYGSGQNGSVSWDDICPDYLSLEASSQAGCDLCGVLRKALLRRNIVYEGVVRIKGRYEYEFNDPKQGDTLVGHWLAHFQCQVMDLEGNKLAAIMFSMSSGDGKLCQIRDSKHLFLVIEASNCTYVKT